MWWEDPFRMTLEWERKLSTTLTIENETLFSYSKGQQKLLPLSTKIHYKFLASQKLECKCKDV